MLYLSSMHRSVLLLLLLQRRALVVGVCCWQCRTVFQQPHVLIAQVADTVFGVLCLSSMPRSVLLLLLLQTCCLLVYFSVGCWQCLQFIHFPRFLFLLTSPTTWRECCADRHFLAQCSYRHFTVFVACLLLFYIISPSIRNKPSLC